MSKIRRINYFFFLIFAFVTISSERVLAACANPTGVAGAMIYNTDYNMMQFCDDSNWISMGANLASETDPEVGTLTNGKWCTTDGTTVNCTSDAPAGTAGTDTQVIFNDGGIFAGDAEMVWDKNANLLDVTGKMTSNGFIAKAVTGAAAPSGGAAGTWSSNGSDVWRATGDVAIGNNSPAVKLDVTGSIIARGTDRSVYVNGMTSSGEDGARIHNVAGSTYIDLKGTGGVNFRIDNVNGSTQRAAISATGRIEANSGYRAKSGVSGGFGANTFNINWSGANAQLWIDTTNVGNISLSSDRRLKHSITNANDGALNRVMKLRPVTYRWKNGELYKDDGTVHEGFIADELQEVIPSAVNYSKDAVDNDGKPQLQSIAPLEVLPVLTKAIQELKAANDDLRLEIEALKAANR